MILTFQLLLTAVLTAAFTVWAGWLALASEAESDLPRFLADQFAPAAAGLPLPRALHVTRLALLGLAGAAGATAIAWWQWSAPWAAGRLLVVVAAVWAVGDLIPRLLAAAAPEAALRVRRPALRTLTFVRPLLALVGRADRIGAVAAERARQRELGAGRRDMLLGVFSLADTTVAEVMTPRIDIVAVDRAAGTHEVLEAFRRHGHSRLPVFDENPDQVLGIIYVKDLLVQRTAVQSGRSDWHRLIRPAAFVPEGKTLDRQMHDFQRTHGHLAIVVDEFGGTAGLVTLEDVLEQVVGEIRDERDTEEATPIEREGDDRFWVQGSVPLTELEGVLEHSFGRDDVDTVGGLALALFGRVPRPGEAIEADGFRIVAEQVARRRVLRVHVQRIRAEEADEGGGREQDL
ncbi:MAG TPA: hemolysin family protein [Gemmatimonadales bacterium]|nr:hemolysin family protein [Gemmatimonadales bacterium]